MKIRYIFLIIILSALISCVNAEPFTPDEGIFAYREVDVYKINEINFTVPTVYKIISQNSTHITFSDDVDRLKITVTDNGSVKKIKKNPSKNITSGKTMFGSIEGYLVDKNGSYTFSYEENNKLVVIKSKDMALMMGAIGKD